MVKKNGLDELHLSELEVVKGAPPARAVEITPDMAFNWLENLGINIINRPLRNSDVQNWASIMKKKEWKLNGATIIISDDGKLLDGQHRLWACVEAKTPFRTYLIEGMTQDVFDTIDVGKKRSAADMLGIHCKLSGGEPIKHKGVIMAAIMTCLEYKQGVWLHRHTHIITHHDKLEFFKKNPTVADWVMKSRVKGTKKWQNSYSANIGAVAFLGSQEFPTKAETFVVGFTTGEDLPSGSPIGKLRDRLMDKERLEKWDRMKLIVRAWNMHVTNTPVKTAKLGMPHELPLIAGTPPPRGGAKVPPPKRIDKDPAIKRRGRPPKAKEHAEIMYIRGDR